MGMGTIHQDFKDFLKLLNKNKVKYLLIGGYAVGYYGYPRATADMDIWVGISAQDNVDKLISSLEEFGIHIDEKTSLLFAKDGKMLRIGFPPVRLEILSEVSGVEFEKCYKKSTTATIGDIEIKLISLEDLKKNKKASGRHKDLDDLENL